MAKYNWEELKQKFLLGDYKSLREFAEREGLNYKSSYFFKRTKGWANEKEAKEKQKRSKIIEEVTEKQIEQEVDYNLKHLQTWSKFLDIVSEALVAKDHHLTTKSGKINVYVLEKLANVMEKIQKGQRLSLGLDEKQQDQINEIANRLQEIVSALDDNILESQ